MYCSKYIIVIGLVAALLISCINSKVDNSSFKALEIIKFYHPNINGDSTLFKTRYTYYSKKRHPIRWIEIDSSGTQLMDYLCEYDSLGKALFAYYKDPGEKNYSVERITYPNDSTKVTEWLDSTGQVYYTMIDLLNHEGQTIKATFSDNESIHGYDTTSYNEQGLPNRIFFTNVKGKVFNDRTFEYDKIDKEGIWLKRRKYFGDSLAEIQVKLFKSNPIDETNRYYPEIISNYSLGENMISFTDDLRSAFFTRYDDWSKQTPLICSFENGIIVDVKILSGIGQIYNGAISPSGRKILYSKKSDDNDNIWLSIKSDTSWNEGINLSLESGIGGGYFNWIDEETFVFYTTINGGDIKKGRLKDNALLVVDHYTDLNTDGATEFSPFLDRNNQWIIFTRYREEDPSNQGFFISYSSEEPDKSWNQPQKIECLEYGWGAFVIKENDAFFYTDGNDVKWVTLSSLALDL